MDSVKMSLGVENSNTDLSNLDNIRYKVFLEKGSNQLIAYRGIDR